VSEAPYPSLRQLMGAYFHQDWDLSGPGWRDVIAEYVADEGPEAARLAADEIAILLRDTPDDGELRRIVLDALDCCYLPEPGGLTMRAWLTEMLHALSAGAG
jgi:hypothetical protein